MPHLRSRFAGGLALLCGVVASFTIASPAQARPGTPNHVTFNAYYGGTGVITWVNTANEGGIVFDIEGQQDPSIANWAPFGGVSMNQKVTYIYLHLKPGPHCFRIWARVGAQGLRSELPSAWACATEAGATTKPAPNPTPTHSPEPCSGLVCGGGGLVNRKPG